MSEAKERLIGALRSGRSRDAADAIEALALKIAAEVAEKHIAAERQRNRPMWDCSDAECERQMAEAAKAELPAGGQRRCDRAGCNHSEMEHRSHPSGLLKCGCNQCGCEGWREPQPPTSPSAGPIGLHEDFLRFCEQRQSSDMQALVAEIRRLKSLNATAPAEGGRTVAEALHSLDCCPIHEDFWRKCPDSCVLFKSVAAYEDGAALPTVACDTERFDWFFGPANKIEAMGEYFVGVQNKWSLAEWRAFCDRWMNAARAAEGKS